jgi:hypothetical protein
VGWYEAGWGPMISETACFVKDVMGPQGSVSIVLQEGAHSADVDTHTRTGQIRIHSGEVDSNGKLRHADKWVSMDDEPGHDELCAREQAFFADAILSDVDLTKHHADAIRSLQIVLAAERSMHEQRAIDL